MEDVTCKLCNGVLIGGIKCKYIKVSVGDVIPVEQYKEKVCKHVEGFCLTNSLLNKIKIVQDITSNKKDSLSNLEIYNIAKDIFSENNIQAFDKFVVIEWINLPADVNPLSYYETIINFNNTSTKVRIEFIDGSLTEAYLIFFDSYNESLTDITFSILENNIVVAKGIFK